MHAVAVEDFMFNAPPLSKRGGPTWEVAFLFPHQGEWTEDEYLAIETNWLMELADGCLQFLPMPTVPHQLIVGYLVDELERYVTTNGARGKVLHAPLPVRLRPGLYREPDVMLLTPEQIGGRDYPHGAELVMEVVADVPRGREHDYVQKRTDYARARIPEYWIVDPQDRKITVLALGGMSYRVHGEFGAGTAACSVLLPGFELLVESVLAAGKTGRLAR
jgi:Uma2 family endonuclease